MLVPDRRLRTDMASRPIPFKEIASNQFRQAGACVGVVYEVRVRTFQGHILELYL